ncbi:MAG: hypothetical protein VKK59_01260 [Vampirovibrionales bacterium]|nr:hypothetical protein [Vampirovibrionales bacterium]
MIVQASEQAALTKAPSPTLFSRMSSMLERLANWLDALVMPPAPQGFSAVG